jgi:hypothetical protein
MRHRRPALDSGDSIPIPFPGEPYAYATTWLWTYIHERPNMGLGGIDRMQKLAIAV